MKIISVNSSYFSSFLNLSINESAHKTVCELIRIGVLDQAASIVNTEFQRCFDQGTSLEIWSLRLSKAELLRLGGCIDEALVYLSSKESDYPPERSDLYSIIGLKMIRGNCLGQLGKYIPSHHLLSEAEFMARDAGIMEMQCDVQHRQAMIFYLQKDHLSSDRIYRTILAASDQIEGWYFKQNALWGIGKNLMAQGFHQEALHWFEESHSISASVGSHVLMAVAWSDMAVCHLALGDDQKSLELLENAAQVHYDAGRIQNYLVALANIGNVYRYRGDYLTAIGYYRRALELAYEIKDPVSIKKWTHNIRLSYNLIRQSVERLRTTA